jgi:hypothetical protein
MSPRVPGRGEIRTLCHELWLIHLALIRVLYCIANFGVLASCEGGSGG